VVSSWVGQLRWGPSPLEDHFDTCRGSIKSHGFLSSDRALSLAMGSLSTFNSLFISPHYVRDDALGQTMLLAGLAVYTGFGT